MCYRMRGLGEERFEVAAVEAGWVLRIMPSHLMHAEYQGGEYRLLCMTRV